MRRSENPQRARVRWPLLPVPPSRTQTGDLTTFCMVSSFKEGQHHAPKRGMCSPLGKEDQTLLRVRSSPERKRPVVLSNYGPLLGNTSQALKRMQRARLNVTWRPPYGEHRSTLYKRTSVLPDRKLRSSQRSERFRAPTLLRGQVTTAYAKA